MKKNEKNEPIMKKNEPIMKKNEPIMKKIDYLYSIRYFYKV